MATTSYSSLFGTNGSGTQSGIGNLFGQQSAQEKPKPATTPTYQQTFAQMQQAGQARPAPPPPQPGTYAPYQGSTQAQAIRAPMLSSLQAQLANPTRFDNATFQQIRQAQQGNLNAEFGAQRSRLEEEMARRGLSSSSIGAGRYGDLAGQQARAQATMDSELLQAAAQTQAQDRLAALQAAGQFADLAGSQDLAQFEANRVGQAQSFQEQLAAANFGQGQSEFDRSQAMEAAKAEQSGGLAGENLGLERDRLMQQNDQFRASLSSDEQRFLKTLEEQQAGRMQQYGLSLRELDQKAMQIAQGDRSLSLQQARDMAEVDLRARQLVQQESQFGRSLSLDEARMQVQDSLSRDQMAMERGLREAGLDIDRSRLSQQESQFMQGMTLDRERMAQQGDQFNLENELRRQLGMGDLDVRRQQATADTQMANNQFLLQLAQALGGLTAAQIQQLFGNRAPTGTPSGLPVPPGPSGGLPIDPVTGLPIRDPSQTVPL